MNPTRLESLLASFQPDAKSAQLPVVQRALWLARCLQELATQLQTSPEKKQQSELDRMLQTPSDKATLAQMTDQAFRTSDPRRAVEHLIHILDVQGVPRFFSPWDRTLMKGFQSFGGYLPGVALPLVKEHMQKETANVILPGEKDKLVHHLAERTREGVRMNVNFLGESVLSEAESGRRLQQYLTSLQWPEIEVVSIKISTVYSQISPLAREHTVSVLCERLEKLFLAADRATFKRPSGEIVPKFVYLDMEEYRDKELTAEAFMRTLSRPKLLHIRAGIALQGYIPDSFRTLQQIQVWARERVKTGGGRITVRLVKGANLENERAEASLRGWPLAPYKSKLETDANYKRMLHAALQPENLAALDVGVASHNLFDIAYALTLAHDHNALARVQFEMLEGMANHQRRALFELSRNLLLYAPACKKEHFINAIGYLVRRLDENTGPENFLRHAFKIKVGSDEWQKLEQGFLAACAAVEQVSAAPRRTQNRQLPPAPTQAVTRGWRNFENEADTDFSLPQNGEWAQQIIAKWQPRQGDQAVPIPLVIGGGEMFDGRTARGCLDPSRPGVVVGKYVQASADDVAEAIECAADDADGWRKLSPLARWRLLGNVAQELRLARGDLMGAALANGGKTLLESDPEVSEAVDFLEFYRDTAREWQELPTLSARGKGVAVVVSPWNFPIAIPCGGIAAALAAGNTVILKPASDTVLVAWEMCQCFWRAGISKKVLQFVPCAGGKEGRQLVNHPKVNAVILTGGTETAQTMLRDSPRLNLFAETGGKNATIVTAVSDRDQVIKHILHSAFGHAGQKCSATSLLLLAAEIYDDPAFRAALCEAVQSLKVGSAWELDTKMGPLIRAPGGDLLQALTTLEPGEEWALKPEMIGGNPNLWTPGIKYGATPGGYTHTTEFFGPLLAVMRFETLSEAVALVNQTGYGLTSGLESLDEREWAYWKENIHAGNLYLNRVTTGAVVLRQPFGGMGKSVFGAGMKAGGPNYVAQFMDFIAAVRTKKTKGPSDPRLVDLCHALLVRKISGAESIIAAIASCELAQRDEFGREHDHFKLVGQDNVRRYLPMSEVRIRICANDSLFEVFTQAFAACLAGCRVTVSVPVGSELPLVALLKEVAVGWAKVIGFIEETDEQLAAVIRAGQTQRVRFAAPERVPPTVLSAGNEAGGVIVSVPVASEGRLEMLWYLREQSISTDYHRYGNLGHRSHEKRAEIL
ncbi:MAG TPA: bifunctional proline dehydrogenase/L-glutamate gamma-semialdehyde dehydrogenase [Verrucomicrobiae bacterium]|jgi:RHH-type proline utilization regulon transcriptional repressor/proline dehydrogenase/delta 1-pyrroline-5-carboxylate dehydrogenase